MTRELQLVFHKDGRRWEFPGVGSVRARNWLGREMIAAAPGREEWLFKGGTVTDPAGAEVLSRADGLIIYRGRQLRMEGGRSGWTSGRAPFVLLEGDRELARFEPKVWARDKPPHITIVDEDFAREEPLLLLYAAFAAHWAAASKDAGAAIGGVTS